MKKQNIKMIGNLDEVKPLEISDQIKIREHLIDDVLVGTLYKDITRHQIAKLRNRQFDLNTTMGHYRRWKRNN